MTYDEMIKQRKGPLEVEKRQSKLAKNGDDLERYLSKLVRIVNKIDQLRKERKRLLNPRKGDKKLAEWTPDKYMAMGGLDDSLDNI